VTSDPASLDNLRDIVEPSAVPWWPLAPGWWFVIALVAFAAAYFSIRAFRSWRADAYRRAALRELAGGAGISSAATLLKRTALVAYPRAEVAALTGVAWCDWLEKTGGESMPESVRSALTHGVFGAGSTASQPELAAFTSAWISSHRTHDTEGEIAC
jgi:hypothetical protein